MSKFRWWSHRQRHPPRLRGQTVSSIIVDEASSFITGTSDTLTLTDGGGVTFANIDSDTIQYSGVSTSAPNLSLTETIENLDNRIDNINNEVFGSGTQYMINNGNTLDLSNSLKDLSMEGYCDYELTDILRQLLERRRSDGQV